MAGVALTALGWLWWCAGLRLVAAHFAWQTGIGDMDLHFACQAWRLVTWAFTLNSRRGTYGTGLALVARWVAACRRRLCVASVALWLAVVVRWVAAGRRTLCVGGVVLGDMDLHFAW